MFAIVLCDASYLQEHLSGGLCFGEEGDDFGFPAMS